MLMISSAFWASAQKEESPGLAPTTNCVALIVGQKSLACVRGCSFGLALPIWDGRTPPLLPFGHGVLLPACPTPDSDGSAIELNSRILPTAA
ncbi:hypothetical protein N7530_010283 [Penicillium desertorum]|uniref:Uncharacterized protein n=1 Tax=Penicillium desertorum TaxID=1303715 RepID=A0A9X0BJ78_9EURO|nr:hypothetical protein N7530_010283 [Penicillium desertorum]